MNSCDLTWNISQQAHIGTGFCKKKERKQQKITKITKKDTKPEGKPHDLTEQKDFKQYRKK